jgi:hypothetical protein
LGGLFRNRFFPHHRNTSANGIYGLKALAAFSKTERRFCIMSEKLDRLRRERDKAERHLRKAANDEKALAHEMARLTRAERTHRLCTRGGMLETFIREPSLLTDNDVMELLTFLFHGEAAQKKLGMLIERRRETAGRETY